MFLQVENEYKPEETLLGPAGVNYMNWDAQMAEGMDMGVPWVMCKHDDVLDPVVSSVNDTLLDIYMIIYLTGHLVTLVSG